MLKTLRADGAFWRRLAYAGARYGPRAWVQYSPPLFGVAFGLVLGTERRAVRRNLRQVCGPRSFIAEQWDVARTFAAYASCLAESLGAERAEAEQGRYCVDGAQHFRTALDQKRGVVLVTAHVGPWDLVSRMVPKVADGQSVMIAMVAEADEGARDLHDGVRERGGARIVHVGRHALDAFPLLKHLRAGGVVAMQLDRRLGGARSIDVSLFDHVFHVPEGPFRLAALAGSPVVPVFARRVGYFDYELTIRPQLNLPARPTFEQLRAAAQGTASEMERFIHTCPTQWFNFGA